MLVYASNNVRIDSSRFGDYDSTWVCAENITYISEGSSETSEFVPSLNFPTYYVELMEMLRIYKDTKMLEFIVLSLTDSILKRQFVKKN